MRLIERLCRLGVALVLTVNPLLPGGPLATKAQIAYIRKAAIARGLDPRAVLAIASHEGLSGGVGDGGHAFGPFQMNDAGGVLTHAPAYQHSNAFAWSHQGINMALNQMAQVAKGLKGRAAVTAIATRYERPANPQAEIQDAMAHYGSFAGGGGAPLGSAMPVKLGPKQATMFDSGLYKRQAAAIMLQDAADRANGTANTDPNALLDQLAQARKAAVMKVASSGPGKGQPIAGTVRGSGGGLGHKAVALAAKQIGIPYVWGGESRQGFDCSGLIQYVYSKLGVKLPRVAADQGRAGRAVAYKALKPGDLLVENNGDHVVMYAGNGRVIQAPHTGTNVQYSPLSWFPSSQYHARRVVG